MISDVPMYIRNDPVYMNTDAYKQAVDESSWEQSSSDGGLENQQSQGLPSTLANLVLIIEIDSLDDEDDEGLLAEAYQQAILDIETGLMNLNNFDQLQLVVYDAENVEDYRKRPNTITNLFDADYAPWAFNHSYDPVATRENTVNFYATSKFVNARESIDPSFDQSTTDTVKTYYAGYGYMDAGGYPGYDTYNSFKFQLYSMNYTLTNLMWTIADSDFGVNPGKTAVEAVMSIHYLGVPIQGYNSSTEDLTTQEDELGKICYETVHDYLWSKQSTNGMKVFWKCTGYYNGWYIGDVIQTDALWLFGTIMFVYIYMIITVNSVFIATMGLFMIFMAFTPGMVLYRYLAGYAYFGTLNMLVLFIMLSIGADDVFVLNDTWQQERNRERVTYKFIKEGSAEEIQKSINLRLQFCLGHAGNVMFTTSISTMMSFISNSVSSFPGIYCFGAFAAIVVAVNYVAVCTFMPCVLVVHELYFWTDESYGCCQVKKRKSTVTNKTVDERRPVDIFLEDKCFSVIYKFRSFILIGFFLIQCIFILAMSRLEPDPNEPRMLPESDPVQQFNDKFTDHFTRFVDPYKITNHITIGIDGIDRSGTDETVPADIGKAIFTEVSFSSVQEQQFLEQICSDAETGWRYGDIDDRMVNFDVTPTLQCFMIQVRNSIYEDSYYETFSNVTLRNAYFDAWYEEVISSGATYVRLGGNIFIDSADLSSGTDISDHFSLCFDDGGPWTSRSFPIADPYNGTDYEGSCFMLILVEWLSTDMSVDDPNYSPGETNYDHYKDFLWAEASETDDETSGSQYLNFFEFTIELSIGSKTNYKEGLDYYENWVTWLDNWKNNEDGENAIFPGYGCDDATSGICIESEYVEIPTSWYSSIMFGDTGLWSYYVMQDTILNECYSGIFLALLFAFCVLVVATGNWLISVYAIIVILCLVIDVMGFTVMMGWKLGVIEAVIYIMVVGMSVDYVVHFSEAYLSSHETLRVHAARRMLGIVGISVISGAVSTLGGIVFLIFSYNQFFYKFGLNIFFLILMALFYALIGFTAAMASFGPQGTQGNTTICCYRCLAIYDEKYKVKADKISDELLHKTHHDMDSLAKLPVSKHSRLLIKRQATLGNEALLAAIPQGDL